jgi:glyoxylase-like metal-dependent hydrolase (beta-lactamase superfamily II)
MSVAVQIHKYTCTAKDWFVNVFLVETANGVVLVDGGLALSSSQEIRELIKKQIRKPLQAILLTHGHPDHYMGIAEIIGREEVPILATRRAFEQAQERDKEAPVLGQFFGADFPARRVFPNTLVEDRHEQSIDNVRFTLLELGPCESESDSVWIIQDDEQEHCFIGDLVYNRMHAFLMDGYADRWIVQLERMSRRCAHSSRLYPGHGEIGGIEALAWQKGYIEAFLTLLRSLLKNKDQLDDTDKHILVDHMKAFLGGREDLLYLLTFGLDQTVGRLRERNVI